MCLLFCTGALGRISISAWNLKSPHPWLTQILQNLKEREFRIPTLRSITSFMLGQHFRSSLRKQNIQNCWLLFHRRLQFYQLWTNWPTWLISQGKLWSTFWDSVYCLYCNVKCWPSRSVCFQEEICMYPIDILMWYTQVMLCNLSPKLSLIGE